jgi:hypothetical protein
MKHILLLTTMLSLALASSAPRMGIGNIHNSVTDMPLVDVEGVILNQQKARVKPGYQFQRESSKSVAILKISNIARIQTGTITCTAQGNRICEVFISKNQAQCSGGCYFVGIRGVPRAQ